MSKKSELRKLQKKKGRETKLKKIKHLEQQRFSKKAFVARVIKESIQNVFGHPHMNNFFLSCAYAENESKLILPDELKINKDKIRTKYSYEDIDDIIARLQDIQKTVGTNGNKNFHTFIELCIGDFQSIQELPEIESHPLFIELVKRSTENFLEEEKNKRLIITP